MQFCPMCYVVGFVLYAFSGAPMTAFAGTIQHFETYCDIDTRWPHTVFVHRATEPLRLQTLTMERDMSTSPAVRVRWSGTVGAVTVACEADATLVEVEGTEMPDGSLEAILLITVPRGMLANVHVE